MRVSKLFGRTSKTEGLDYKISSHRLLTQAGFIRESSAGRYYLLPLGLRVHDKIVKVVRNHMDSAGAQELLMPVLHPLDLWKETNRTNTTGFELMKITDRRDAEFALGGTAEEMAVDLVRKFNLSYKDLPFNIYQFSMKFRDEMRARGGLLRVREFVMKDGYSFSTEEQFKEIYQQMWDAYAAICTELGLTFDIVAADNGYIGGEYCHEFVAESEAGESRYFIDEKSGYAAHEDVAVFQLEPVNIDEPMGEFQIVQQPDWVKTMEDMEKHYGKDKRFFLKDVAYVTREGDIVIVVIRGDLDVNKTKLEQKLKLVGQLESASIEDLTAIGTKPGYVQAWGHDFLKPRKAKNLKRNCTVTFVADESLKTVHNFTGGHATFEKGTESDSINVNYGRDFKHDIELDIAMAQPNMTSLEGGKLVEKRGIEVGNIFQLGYHYSNLMSGAEYTDDKGQRQKYYMGCYGFGIGRSMAAVVESHQDDRGIIWPANIAPYTVYVASMGVDQTVASAAESLYAQLLERGVEVLYDDRDVRAGEKFADADLIGIPFRVVVSAKTIEIGQYELKGRTDAESQMVSFDELLEVLHGALPQSS